MFWNEKGISLLSPEKGAPQVATLPIMNDALCYGDRKSKYGDQREPKGQDHDGRSHGCEKSWEDFSHSLLE